MKTLMVTVDSLPRDHCKYITKTRSFLNGIHDRGYTLSTSTSGSFLGTIGGAFANSAGLSGDNVATPINEHSVGLTTNHLQSEKYRFDLFDAPKGNGESVKDEAAIHLTRGSFAYRVGSWGWNQYQRLTSLTSDLEKSFGLPENVFAQFDLEIEERDDWFGWLHIMEPHHPYDPDSGELSQAEAQPLSRKALAKGGDGSDREDVRELYRREVEKLDAKLATISRSIPDDTRVVSCTDHGKIVGEDELWGNPGEMRPEPLHVPFGAKNATKLGDVVSLLDIAPITLDAEHGLEELNRNVAVATYGDKKVAMNGDNIATESGVVAPDSPESVENPSMERSLNRFEPGSVVNEDALEEDLADQGYL